MKGTVAALVVCTCFGWLVIAFAQGGQPAGPQFQVNTTTQGRQASPAVAIEPGGRFLVAWHDLPHPNNPDGAADDIRARLYDSSGNPVGGDFQVNTATIDDQTRAAVAAGGDGNFVVAWESFVISGTYSSIGSVQAQRLDSTGAPIGGEFRVNTADSELIDRPAVDADSLGNFVVVWENVRPSATDPSYSGILGQVYDSAGAPVGGEIQVNAYTTGFQVAPDVAFDGSGNFVVVWGSDSYAGGDTDRRSIQGQRFGSDGVPIGAEFQINSYTPGSQSYPAIANASSGGFVVTWRGNASSGNDTLFTSVHARRLDGSGAPIGAEFQVNTYTTGFQQDPDVAADAAGNFIVIRSGDGAADTDEGGIFGQRYDNLGNPVGGEFLVNDLTADQQSGPGVAVTPDGDFVVAWSSATSLGSDQSGYSIQARRFQGPLAEPLLLTVTGVFNDEDLDGLGDPGETLTFTFEVTNPDVPFIPLTNVGVTAPGVSPITCPGGNPIPSLGGGATEICTGSYTLTQADVDAGTKTVTATVDSDQTGPVTAGGSVSLGQGPAIDIVKSGVLDPGPDGVRGPGDLINYTFDVTNTGNVTLSNATILDLSVATVTCPGGHPIASLAPGASVTCTGSYAITQTDIEAGFKNNTANLTADDPDGSQVSDTDFHNEVLPRIPLACSGEAFLVRNVNAELAEIDQTVSPFVFVPVGAPTGREINNLGFRSTDGLLYGVELTSGGNLQIVQIDATGTVFGLGRPAGLPSTFRFDGGDVSSDGSTMYVTANNSALYLVALPSLAVTSVTKSGATGNVFDWAYNPADGRLYGGDSSSGQLAILDPATGVRTDLDLAGLPSGDAYGGAWFNAASQLFLYRNNGEIYEIDLTGPTVVDVQTGPGATRNDGAACVQSAIGAAKRMVATTDGLPETVTLDLVFENRSVTEDLFNLSSTDDLSAVFGIQGTDWTFTSISSVPASFANPGFDGDTDVELINRAPSQSLPAGASATITVTLELLTIDQGGIVLDTSDLALQTVVSGLASPVAVTHAGDSRLFVTLRAGRVVIVDGGAVLPQPFLDIAARVGSSGGEQGLFSVAFHPDYSGNGFFFVHYTDLAGDSVIARFSVTADPNVADPASEAVLLNIPQPFANHNGGQLQFGPDGFLYVALGDGGSANDPGCEGQDGSTLLGSMLRLDVDQNAGTPPFHGIPPSNPFVGDATVRDEIWALGLRNPWRFSFDRVTGDMYIGDVGQGAREEIDLQAAAAPGGENYGWKVMEGTLCTGNISGCGGITLPACNDPGLTLPILDYSHSAGRCSVTGGYVYRGGAIPQAVGAYFYGDFCTGEIFAAQEIDGTWQSSALPTTAPFLTTFGEGADGELYVVSGGTLSRLTGPAGPEFCNQVLATGEDAAGSIFADLSTAGLDPDPNGDRSPDERQPTCLVVEPDPVPAPAIQLVKTGALDLGGDGVSGPGDVITYTFDLTNTGNVPLSDVTVSDPMVAPIDCGGVTVPPQVASLAPAATASCTGSYAITQADIDAGQKVNTATVSARDAGGTPVTDQSTHVETIPAPPGGGPPAFACTGDAYIVQNQNAQLTVIDRSVSPFVFVPIGGPTGIEINNLGFRSTDGLLYGVELNAGGNVQIVQLDANGDVTGLGRPAGLPTGPRFDAGDVSPDGSTMYITSNNQDLYRLDLTAVPSLPAVSSVNVTGATGFVFDWAVSPIDGMLYGGDSSQGQLAILDPLTGVRTDVNVAGLPSGSGYGGAWFDAGGTLFLYQNSGVLYEIDLAGPTVVNTQTGPGATRNDGAACVDLTPPAAAVDLVKTGSLDLGGDGQSSPGDLINYTFDVTNTGTDPLTNVTLSDPMIASFTCPGGHPVASLAAGASVTCTGSYAITQADIDARVKDNTATVTADGTGGQATAQDSHSEPIPAPPGAGPVPFACTGDAYIVQNQNAQLTRIDLTVSPFVFVPIGGPTGIEINNLGFRRSDGLLYGVELSAGGNVQIVQLDANGDVTGLGRPAGLPTGPRFDAGDVSPDGSTMYITSNGQALYSLDLTSVPTLPAVTSVAVTGASGFVFDWAVSPIDGRLYGGDSSQGQLAILDPATGVRTDVNVAGLPSGAGYGGAWFDIAGTLFLYQNDGNLYEIDTAGPTVVNTQSGPGASRNDGAACIDLAPPVAAIDLVKSGVLDLGDNGTTDVGDIIDYTFQVTNTGTDVLTNVTLSDPLIASFTCPGGHPIPSLTGGASETCTASYAITQVDVNARVRENTATVTGTGTGGPVSAQDNHAESIPAPPGAGPAPFACTGEAYIIQDQSAQLTLVDQSVSPFVFVPVGNPTGIEINNLGFRSTDGLLYALQLAASGNVEVIQIDSTGTVFGLGRPAGLPTGPRFDAGDVSPDGSTMYITSNNQNLYVLDLSNVPTLPAVSTVNVTGATGFVFDWAVSPVDGMLYGGDSTSGQLAILDPVTGVRTDVALAGLPSGAGYGGAWFDAGGTLFLYQNSGVIYEIDLAGPTVVNTQAGPGANRNDGAACIDLAPVAADIGLVKNGVLDLGGNGIADPGDVIEYAFDVSNQGTDPLTNVTITDPDVPLISCSGGHPIPTLAAGTTVTCLGFYDLTQADIDARVKVNTAGVTADHPSGAVSDQDTHSINIPAPPDAGPVPFACTGEAYIVQNQNAQLTLVDQSVSPFAFVPIGSPAGIEINNLGFRSTDGLLYGLELTGGGNIQVIQIDATGTVFGLGRPPGLPSGPRFDAGDVSPDGSTMYITSNNQALYRLDLTSVPALPAVTSVPVTGATGFVFDWAVNPFDGKLYGGDSTSGQLASIDPATGVRTDVNLAGLPAGAGYGGAWFDATGKLFLYQNDGNLYEIDLTVPRVDNTQAGPGASRNDGAACIDLGPPAGVLSLVKTGVLDLGANGTTDVGDVIDYTFEVTNQSADAMTNVTLSDPGVASITCPGGLPISILAAGATVTCTASYAITQADVDARGRDNTASAAADHPSGPASAQDSHSQPIPAPPGAAPQPFACTGDAYIVQGQDAQLALVDQSVSPFVFVPVGGPAGIEINNLGFRSTDGLLYALELTADGNAQVIQIDSNGDVFGLGRPAGLPAEIRFDAGDVSPDGSTLYITSNNQALYRLDLTSLPALPAVTSVPVIGPVGFVFDWAVSPIDGRLYGGNSISGQLAILDPATGVRTDVDVDGLPSGEGYGGAWFDNSGRLFLYRNSGAIYEIDLAGPIVVTVRTGPGASRNDGAACVPESQVNTFTLNDQASASVALDSDGDFVIVWHSDGSNGTDGSGISIQGQRYASDGSAVGGEFQVNTYTTGNQRFPAVSMDADGDFVVVWNNTVSDTSSSVQGQRYASNGFPVGGQFQVNISNTGNNLSPAVALDADGDFVVVWHGNGIDGHEVQGRRYTSDGSPISTPFQINTYTTGNQTFSTVSLDTDGDFVVVWASEGSQGTDTSFDSIQGQRYASDGSPVGGEFQINTYTTNKQRFPEVSLDADGDFVVVWDSRGSAGNDTTDYSVQGQRYASDGSPAGGQFQVNVYTTSNQRIPSVALDASGDFVVVWDSRGSAGTDTSDYSIQGQRYASDGSTLGGPFQVNTYTTVFQIRPAISMDAGGDFVVVWDSTGSGSTDSSGRSVQKAHGSL